MRPTPWLAERWEWRAEGLELVFLLRDDVLWHDGVPLTAADAAFTFEVYRSDTDSAGQRTLRAGRERRRDLRSRASRAFHRPRCQLALQCRNPAHRLPRAVR